jgi:hypothetical protein
MRCTTRFLAALLALTFLAHTALGVDGPSYQIRYSARFLPAQGIAAAEISTTPQSGRLIGLDLNMPADSYRDPKGDGKVERHGNRVLWTPPRAGGTLRYKVVVDHRRKDDSYDSRMTQHWVITRGDRLFPPAKVRATKGSESSALLHIDLPPGWDDAETPFTKVQGGNFAVTNPERRFDRPVGWIAAGKLTSTREAIAEARVTLTAPSGVEIERMETLAILRHALPKMADAFGALPEKLLVVRSDDPMWRGGLSAPRSLWLHADRPLISENGTSPMLHELVHVVTAIRGGPEDDWIAEGLAEFYSLEISRRAGLISQRRFDKAIERARASGASVESLRGQESTRDRTRRAVAIFATLDQELRERKSSLDDLAQLLMRREKTTLNELRADVERLKGHTSKALAAVE